MCVCVMDVLKIEVMNFRAREMNFKEEQMFKITIKVDTNDGDYATSINEISEEELEKIKPLIEAISKFVPYVVKDIGKDMFKWDHGANYPFGVCQRPDLGEKTPQELYGFVDDVFELFEEFVPLCDGFHIIESIYIQPAGIRTKLL